VRTFVVDASVGAKWFLPAAGEPLAAEAQELLDHYTRGRVHLLVPDLFWAELGNVLWKAIVRNRITLPEAEDSIARARRLNIPTVPVVDLLIPAFPVARASNRSIYDSIYVAAAMVATAPLLTADQKLFNAAGTLFPVRWLGTLQAQL
jgi:predicted nucleic acid-binding protein